MIINSYRYATGAAWTPADLAGLMSWHDASDTATITHSGGAVSQWDDKKGSNHLVQATGSAQPTTGTRTLNSLNVLDFGVGDFLEDTTYPIPTSGNVMFSFVFMADDATGGSQSVFSADATSDFDFQSVNAAFNGRILRGNVGGSNSIAVDPPIAEGVDVIFVITWDFTSGKMRMYRDGVQCHVDSTDNDYTTKLDTIQAMRVFANRAGVSLLDGMFAQLIVSEEVDTTSRQKIEGYLAHTYALTANLPSGHPYKSVAP